MDILGVVPLRRGRCGAPTGNSTPPRPRARARGFVIERCTRITIPLYRKSPMEVYEAPAPRWRSHSPPFGNSDAGSGSSPCLIGARVPPRSNWHEEGGQSPTPHSRGPGHHTEPTAVPPQSDHVATNRAWSAPPQARRDSVPAMQEGQCSRRPNRRAHAANDQSRIRAWEQPNACRRHREHRPIPSRH